MPEHDQINSTKKHTDDLLSVCVTKLLHHSIPTSGHLGQRVIEETTFYELKIRPLFLYKKMYSYFPFQKFMLFWMKCLLKRRYHPTSP